jgi:hypothetical protein
VPFPAHHAAVFAGKFAPKLAFAHGSTAFGSKQFLSLLSRRSAGQFLPLSGSQLAFQQQTKAIVQNAFNYGTSISATNILQAQISNGSLTGGLYFNVGGNTYEQIAGQTPATLTLGSNPFNIGGGATPPPAVGPSTNNFLDLKTILLKPSGGGMTGIKVLLPGGPPPSHLSLATQSVLNRFKGLNEGGVAAGLKAGTLGPITSGEFSGTFYDGFPGGVYQPTGRFVFAFGNNPLNITQPFVPVQITNLANFVDFGTLQKTISAGRLFSTVYAPTVREGVIFALGKDALNNFPMSVTQMPTNLTSYLFF